MNDVGTLTGSVDVILTSLADIVINYKHLRPVINTTVV